MARTAYYAATHGLARRRIWRIDRRLSTLRDMATNPRRRSFEPMALSFRLRSASWAALPQADDLMTRIDDNYRLVLAADFADIMASTSLICTMAPELRPARRHIWPTALPALLLSGWQTSPFGSAPASGPVPELAFAVIRPRPAGVLQVRYSVCPGPTTPKKSLLVNGRRAGEATLSGPGQSLDIPLPTSWSTANVIVSFTAPGVAAADPGSPSTWSASASFDDAHPPSASVLNHRG